MTLYFEKPFAVLWLTDRAKGRMRSWVPRLQGSEREQHQGGGAGVPGT